MPSAAEISTSEGVMGNSSSHQEYAVQDNNLSWSWPLDDLEDFTPEGYNFFSNNES